jgi:SAM-dependent methyltransferase
VAEDEPIEEDLSPWLLPAVAERWQEAWAPLMQPARRALLAARAPPPGARLLDLASGTGEFGALAVERKCRVTGIDSSPTMVAVARAAAPGADFVEGDLEALPFPDASFDLVTGTNAVQFAEDADDAVAEAVRVLAPGGRLGLCSWGPRADQDVNVVGRALALLDRDFDDEVSEGDDDPAGESGNGAGEEEPGSYVGDPGVLENLLTTAGLTVEATGEVASSLELRDEAALVHTFEFDAGVLEGAPIAAPGTIARVIRDAAEPFRTPDGGYRLSNTFRWVIARKP